MDVCTLVIPTMVTLMGCLPGAVQCHFDTRPHIQRQFCEPAPAADCNNSSPVYVCVRPDKSTYTLPLSDAGGYQVEKKP